MAIEIVDFSIKNGDFHSYVSLPEDKPPFSYGFPMVFPLKPPFSPMVSLWFPHVMNSGESPTARLRRWRHPSWSIHRRDNRQGPRSPE